MRATALGTTFGIHAARLDDEANFAEKIFADAWRKVIATVGVPREIYPADISSERLLTICSTLAQWLGTAAGQAHVQSATEAVGEEDDVDFWHPSPNEILPLRNCQDSEMAFGFFEWLSAPDGIAFVVQTQERISAIKDTGQ
ncbi:hypothetical protein [Pseudomonas baetica]|uniref:hypothetical protein n=1 Tax=Pseudomonas baetica TaxID=674054 RepID=UPI0024064E8F|nr:hypothetical protein [Pseudomonas baetica]MDF9779104.1 hypothetical protein [Pseudomonas baetica]